MDAGVRNRNGTAVMTGRASYWFWDSVIPGDVCDQIIESAEAVGFSDGTIGAPGGASVNKKIRNNGVCWMPRMHLAECILGHHAHEANVSTGWNIALTHTVEPVQIAKYSAIGRQFYGIHDDLMIYATNKLLERKMTTILLLSDPATYSGGDIEVGGEIVKIKGKGSIVSFPVFLRHQVKPVTKGMRLSATCWVAGPRFK